MIQIFTDYGTRGPYAGQLRAVLTRMAPDIPAVDLMHDAPACDPFRAAYLLAALAGEMREGDICLAIVDPGVGGTRPPVIVSADGRLFVGPGDGLFEILQRRAADAEAWVIDWRPARLTASFHGRDLFAPAAAMLARSEWPDSHGLPADWRDAADRPGADWPDDLAEVVYIDGFGNAVTGLRAGGLGSDMSVALGEARFMHADTFGDVAEGRGFWYENSMGLVEVAVNRGSAADKFGIAVGAPVSLY